MWKSVPVRSPTNSEPSRANANPHASPRSLATASVLPVLSHAIDGTVEPTRNVEKPVRAEGERRRIDNARDKGLARPASGDAEDRDGRLLPPRAAVRHVHAALRVERLERQRLVLAGPPLRPHRPQRRGQVHVHEDPRRATIEPDTGTISRPKKLGILRQDHFALRGDARARRGAAWATSPLWAAMQEKDALLAQAGHHRGRRQPARRARGRHRRGGRLHRRVRRGRAARRAWASTATATRARCASSPGGLKLRVLLAQALFGKPEGLLLDEPTNNLDLDSIRWLETFLREYEGVLITISPRPPLPERDLHPHRRHRLRDHHHLHRRLRRHGDGRRARCASRVESENAEKQKKIAQLQDFVARFHAGTRASQVQSRTKQIEKLQARRPQALATSRGRSSSSSRSAPAASRR